MRITGKIMVRDSGVVQDNKKVYMVFGCIGIEKGNLLSEHQYTIADLKLINPIDKSEISIGDTPNGLLQQPIWQI